MQLATIPFPCLWWSMHAYHNVAIEGLRANTASIAQLLSSKQYRCSAHDSRDLLLRFLLNQLSALRSLFRVPFSIRLANLSEIKQCVQAIADQDPELSISMPLSSSGGASAYV